MLLVNKYCNFKLVIGGNFNIFIVAVKLLFLVLFIFGKCFFIFGWDLLIGIFCNIFFLLRNFIVIAGDFLFNI